MSKARSVRRDEEEALLLLMSETRTELAVYANELVTATITIEAFFESVTSVLLSAHAQAAYLGRVLAGDATEFGDLDDAFAESTMVEESAFLDGFLAALQAGEYTGEDGIISLSKLLWRLGLYVDRLLGTANEAWVRTLGNATMLFYWHLDDLAHHCEGEDSCPNRQLGSPHRLDDLLEMGLPGSGRTPCGVKCRCWVTTGTGERGFDVGEGES